QWPGAALSVPALPWCWSLVLLFLICAFPFAARTGRGARLVLIGAAAFSGRWCWQETWDAWRRPASVNYLDVGQGDGAVLRLPGAVILIDAGPPEAGRNVILPYLREQGINRLDLVIVTHPDLDHYGGLAYVAAHMPIGTVAYSGEDADTHAWKDLRTFLSMRRVPMIRVARGQNLYDQGVKRGAGGEGYGDGDTGERIILSVLSPEYPGQFPDRNENSVVTLLLLNGRRFLFTGDMGPLTESRLLAQAGDRMQGSILKVPHHGSDLSNDPAFLAAVRPPVAVLSAGRLNRFGHPGRATVAALKGLESSLFLTARDGAVTYACDRGGGRWSAYLRAGPGVPVDISAYAGRANNAHHDHRGQRVRQDYSGFSDQAK
ncbi:MAG: ComEC/Rec2 family competence protein, partial [Fibrobacteria bacterium]